MIDEGMIKAGLLKMCDKIREIKLKWFSRVARKEKEETLENTWRQPQWDKGQEEDRSSGGKAECMSMDMMQTVTTR